MASDLELLEQWRGGDASAGRALFERHFQALYRFFEHKCRGQVDDLVQRTFLQCLEGRDRFQGRSSFRTFLYAIARHELYHHLRDGRRDAQLDFTVTSIQDLVTTAHTRLARAQEIEHLLAALRVLPAEQQLLLELHFWHELDAAQLGEVFDAPAVTIRTRLFRARQALRTQLEARLGPGASVVLPGEAVSADASEPGDR